MKASQRIAKRRATRRFWRAARDVAIFTYLVACAVPLVVFVGLALATTANQIGH